MQIGARAINGLLLRRFPFCFCFNLRAAENAATEMLATQDESSFYSHGFPSQETFPQFPLLYCIKTIESTFAVFDAGLARNVLDAT